MNMHDDRTSRLLTETLASGLTPIEPAPSVRAQWLERLRGTERFTLFGADLARVFGMPLADALAALRLLHTEEAWIAGRKPGSRWMTTPALQQHGVVISRLPAGTRLAQHGHTMRELTFVLDGLVIEDGVTHHAAGSLIDKLPGSEHSLQVADDEHCLVVFAKR